MTPGVKDTLFLGSARGAKEAVDLFTRREFIEVSMQKQGNKHTTIYSGSGRLKANSPTPACLDRCHHGGELQVVFLARDPEGWWLEVGDEQILPWGDHLSSPPQALV